MVAQGLRALAVVLFPLAGAAAAAFWARWRAERKVLRRWLARTLPSERITTRDDLVALKRALSESIRWDPARMHDPRPLLRARAASTLRDGQGFCGENARAAVTLLRLGGVPAHRLYLQGERWGHVVVEHRWEGSWRLFDAHVDPRTALPDDQVGRIDTAALDRFPNGAAENPWRRSYRIPGLGRTRWGSRLRPPALVTALAESPDLLVATACGLVALGSAIALLVS